MKYILVLLTLIASPCFSQQIILNRSIEWERNRNLDYLYNFEGNHEIQIFYFENAFYENHQPFFPYYTELINVEDYYQTGEITLENQVFSKIFSSDYKKVQDLDQIGTDIQFETEIRLQQKKPFVYLKILPLRKNPDTGEIEKLVSFSIKILTSTKKNSEPVPSLHQKKSTGISSQDAGYKNSSVLNEGDWYKIKVTKTGVYKLTFSDISSMGITDPSGIRVFGNGGKMVPLMNNVPRKDDLYEIPVYMDKGTDGVFNSGDYILFYAEGPVTWQYSQNEEMFLQSVHGYSGYICYFLTSTPGGGKKIEEIAPVTLPATHTVTTYDAFDYHENNKNNLIESGRQWFGEEISNTSFDTTFIFKNLDTSVPLKIKANAASQSGSTKKFTIRANGKEVGKIETGSVALKDIAVIAFARQSSGIFSYLPENENINVSINYNKTESSDRGWLDYFTLNARRKLTMDNSGFLFFRDMNSTGEGNVSEFRIANTTQQTIVWDITDINNVKNITLSSGKFKTSTGALREFVAFNKNASFLTPSFEAEKNRVENQNLHGTSPHKMIIVTHPLFISQAEKLAQFHRDKDHFSVFVTTTDKIYNEFSSGVRDVSAIRDFVRMIYERSGNDENSLRYLLLFGDGSYNNHMDHELNPNLIPTYQSENSLYPIYSYVTDDFFGLLDPDEGGSNNMESFLLDIGIGRLPVKDTVEASSMIKKIFSYNTPKSMLDWRNSLMFVGDDDGERTLTFMETSSEIGDYVMNNYPQYSVKKVLLDAYKLTTTATGNRYPDVHRTIIDNFNKGTLLFNYLGHGGEKAITAEFVLTREDMANLRNKFYPVFVTATCEFSRFDWLAKNDEGGYTEEKTIGEVALMNANGGAIALLTTTRVVGVSENNVLNKNFYKFVFGRDSLNQRYRLGDIAMKTKNLTGGSNQLNFTLLGDPALEIAYPELFVKTDSVNGVSVSEPLDTLKAFSKVTVSGTIISRDSVPADHFNGYIYPSVFDKKQLLKTLSNSGNDPVLFYSQENLIYHGKATVNNGKFSFSFIVPKDITYNIGHAKISYYAEDSLTDAHGYFSGVSIGGTSEDITEDFTGPTIDLYLNDTNFRSGGITGNDPVLLGIINDLNGINTTSVGIGHDITGILDGETQLILNSYFQGNVDDFASGVISYNMYDLEPGLHTLEVKVWDVFNNSSVAYIEFIVKDGEILVLDKLMNYPNPMRDHTSFQFEHNKADLEQKITIDIFDLSGRLVHTIKTDEYQTGYRSERIEWDGKGNNGNRIPSGIYPYRIRVETSDGEIAEQFKKLIIIN